MNNQDKKQTEAHAFLYSQSQAFEGNDLLSHLEYYLSEEMPVTRSDDRGPRDFISLPPWIDITLIFASTTIATSILSKLGEDIYNKLKSSLATLFKEKNEKGTGLSITIMIEDVAVKAVINCRDYEEVLEAIKATQQMFLDVYNKKNTELKAPQKSARTSLGKPVLEQLDSIRRIHRDVLPESIAAQHTNLLSEYVYDASTKQWSLEGIHKKEDEETS